MTVGPLRLPVRISILMSEVTQDSGRSATAMARVKTHGLKYSAVSVVNVVIGQGLLFLFVNAAHLGATTSNVLAVSISAVPAYLMNRAWVWGRRGKHDFKREVVPFWGFALLGLIVSTVAVTVATQVFDVPVRPEDWKKFVPSIASLSAFGVLWVIKFFVLDAVIFGPHHHLKDFEEGLLDDVDEESSTSNVT